MIVAPLIHTRTFSTDFDPKIKAVPKSFLDSDINWARKSILEATKSIDSLQGERWVIIDNSKYRIAGIVGFLKDICNKCHSVEDFSEVEQLFYDDKKRLVYAFIGVVIDKEKTTKYCPISYDYLWDIFVKLINPIWKRSYQEQIRTDFESFEASTDIEISALPDKNLIGTKELYESNAATDYNLFVKTLCTKSQNDFSFCSNVSDYNAVKECSFSIITTSLNNITRIMRSSTVTTVGNSESAIVTSAPSEDISLKDTSNGKKNVFLKIFLSCLTILLIIIVIALLLVITER